MQNLKPTFEHYFPEGSEGGECAAFAEKLVKFGPVDTLFPKVTRFESKMAYVKKYGSTNIWDIQVGDVVITDESKTSGHVFVVNADCGQTWQVTESNYHGDGKVNHTRQISKFSAHLKGHIRSSFLVKIINPSMNKKVLVLLSKVPADIEAIAKKGISRYCEKVKARTNGEFQIVVEYASTDAVFHTIHAANPDGSEVIFADPNEIGVEGTKVEQSLGEDFDSVCLIYNPDFIIGDQPNHPVDNPTTISGFNPFSIPTTWIGNVPPGSIGFDGSQYSAQLFFAHENSHSDFYIAMTESNQVLRDKTHDPNPHSAITPTDDPTDFFIDLLIELKPYWLYLGHPEIAVGESFPMNTYKFSDNATEYILTDNATLIPLTAAGLTKTLAGRKEKLVTLAPTERSKYTIVTSAVV